MAKQRKQHVRRTSSQKLMDRLTLSLRLMFDGRVEFRHKLIPPLALLYILSPVDFVPDLFLPFGILDDIGVAVLALEAFIRMAPPDVVKEHVAALKARFEGKPDLETAIKRDENEGYGTGDIIEGAYRKEG